MSYVKNPILKNILILALIIILIPLFDIILKILFAYGQLIGSYARYIIEGKIC